MSTRPTAAASMGPRMLLILVSLSTISAFPVHPGQRDFDPGRVNFTVRVKSEVTNYSVLAVSVMPGTKLSVEVVGDWKTGRFSISATGGKLRSLSDRRWEWLAPRTPNPYELLVRNEQTGQEMRLVTFVLVPGAQIENGELNGYRIESYPSTALRGLEIYRPPKGFIEVTESNIDTPVSPHFTLGQFVCKQEGGFPKYLVLRERLLLKLEVLLEEVNQAGHRTNTFHVMSGYRTPYYNKRIGNREYSRHIYGGAADIFIDELPRDGVLDDLNFDGKTDFRDATVLYTLIDGLSDRNEYEIFRGGLGRYRSTEAHGPFVHVDARGFRARW